MKKFFPFIFLALTMAAQAPADQASDSLGLFANAKEIFRPLVANPRALQLSVRLTTPVSQTNLGDIAMGDYFGLYRWALPWKDSFLQWSIGGGVFARFDLVSEEKDNEVLDYSFNMPVDLKIGKWSMRLMPYHISSHLGDDYIKRTGILPEKYSFDSFKQLFAYDPWACLRLYAGYNYIIRNITADLGRYAVQAGIEWRSLWWAGGHAQLYWANDFQSWERTAWNPTINSQLGVRIARNPLDNKAIAFFSEYGAGHLAYGQFFQQEESHWVLGMRFKTP